MKWLREIVIFEWILHLKRRHLSPHQKGSFSRQKPTFSNYRAHVLSLSTRLHSAFSEHFSDILLHFLVDPREKKQLPMTIFPLPNLKPPFLRSGAKRQRPRASRWKMLSRAAAAATPPSERWRLRRSSPVGPGRERERGRTSDTKVLFERKRDWYFGSNLQRVLATAAAPSITMLHASYFTLSYFVVVKEGWGGANARSLRH